MKFECFFRVGKDSQAALVRPVIRVRVETREISVLMETRACLESRAERV